MPVAIRMDLSFTETEIQTKQSLKKSIPNGELKSIFGKGGKGNGVSTGDFAFGKDEGPINQDDAENAFENDGPDAEDLTAADPDVNVENVDEGESI
jgi:hypothetical protein